MLLEHELGFITTTSIDFIVDGIQYSTSWTGTPDIFLEYLPDTPATYILFDKQGKVE